MKHIPVAQLDALAQPIPFHHLIPLANLDQRIKVEQIADPDQLEQALKRRVLARLHRGELCMIPAWRASAYGTPKALDGLTDPPAHHIDGVEMLDVPAFLRRHAD